MCYGIVLRDAMDAPQTNPQGTTGSLFSAAANLEPSLSRESCWSDLDFDLSRAIERELLDTAAATHTTASLDDDEDLLSSLLLAQAGSAWPGQSADPGADLLRRQQEEQHRRQQQQRQRRRAAMQALIDNLSLPQLEQALALVKSRQHQQAAALAASSAPAPPPPGVATPQEGHAATSSSSGSQLLQAMVLAPSADSMLQAVSSYIEQLEGGQCEAGLEQVSNLLADPQHAEVAGALVPLSNSLHAAQAVPTQVQVQQLCSSLHAALAAPQVAAAASALRSRVAAAAEQQRRRSASCKRGRSPDGTSSSSGGSLASGTSGLALRTCGLPPPLAQAAAMPLFRPQPPADWSAVDSAASAQAAMDAARSRAAMLQARVAKRARVCATGDAAPLLSSRGRPGLSQTLAGNNDNSSQFRLQQACVAELQRRLAAQQPLY